MLGAVTEKFQGLIAKLAGKGKLTEENITDAVNEVRLALLEADVNYAVAKNFVKKVKDKVLGEQVLKSVTPGQQFIKVVHDELVALMGGTEVLLQLDHKPAFIMTCGLQGSGKTTTIAAMLDYVNERKPVHIVTIEDPIEYLLTDKKATINQREIGIDSDSFGSALRAALDRKSVV